MRLMDSIRQYGSWNSLKRLTKRVLRPIGLEFEDYFVLFRNLTGEIARPPLAEGLRATQLTHEDFLYSPFYTLYSPAKREIYAQRFADPAWRAFGVYRDSDLVYMTWVARDAVRIDRIGWKRPMKKNEGVLVDSYTLPDSRRLGIHAAMNGFRLQCLYEDGAERAYVVYLAENLPAARTQRKFGFVSGWKVTYVRIGRWTRILERSFRL